MESKTALQELLDWTSDKENWIPSEEHQSVLISYIDLKRKIKSLLSKEKEQIETAFEGGVIDSQVEKFGFGEHYYNKTYKTDEK